MVVILITMKLILRFIIRYNKNILKRLSFLFQLYRSSIKNYI